MLDFEVGSLTPKRSTNYTGPSLQHGFLPLLHAYCFNF